MCWLYYCCIPFGKGFIDSLSVIFIVMHCCVVQSFAVVLNRSYLIFGAFQHISKPPKLSPGFACLQVSGWSLLGDLSLFVYTPGLVRTLVNSVHRKLCKPQRAHHDRTDGKKMGLPHLRIEDVLFVGKVGRDR